VPLRRWFVTIDTWRSIVVEIGSELIERMTQIDAPYRCPVSLESTPGWDDKGRVRPGVLNMGSVESKHACKRVVIAFADKVTGVK
jgi:hypothetical protein